MAKQPITPEQDPAIAAKPKFKRIYIFVVGGALALAAIFYVTFAGTLGNLPPVSDFPYRGVLLHDETVVDIGTHVDELKGRGPLIGNAFPMLAAYNPDKERVEANLFTDGQRIRAIFIPPLEISRLAGFNIAAGLDIEALKLIVPGLEDNHPYLTRLKKRGAVKDLGDKVLIFFMHDCKSEPVVNHLAVVSKDQAAIEELAEFFFVDTEGIEQICLRDPD